MDNKAIALRPNCIFKEVLKIEDLFRKTVCEICSKMVSKTNYGKHLKNHEPPTMECPKYVETSFMDVQLTPVWDFPVTPVFMV